MAPKIKGQGNSQPKKKVATKLAAKSRPQGTSVFDDLAVEHECRSLDASAEKTKSLHQRTVAKLRYHFGGSAHTMVYVRASKETGLTLFERVLKDTAAQDKHGSRDTVMGTGYWAARKMEYWDEADEIQFAKLHIEREEEEDDIGLRSALKPFMKNNFRATTCCSNGLRVSKQ